MGSSPACGQQQRGQQRQRWRARPAAARPVHSSSRGGAGGSLAARRTSTGSPRAPGHFVLPRALAGHWGAFAKLFVPLTCSLASALPPETWERGSSRSVLRSSSSSAGRSVPGSLGRSNAPCVSGSRRLQKSVPSAWSCGLGAHSAEAPPASLRSLFSPNLSLSTNSTTQHPSPDQWQRRAQAGVPAPSAAASWTRTFQGISESS